MKMEQLGMKNKLLFILLAIFCTWTPTLTWGASSFQLHSDKAEKTTLTGSEVLGIEDPDDTYKIKWITPSRLKTYIENVTPVTTGAEIAALFPTVTTATDYTIGTGLANEAYGGVIYVTGAATITAPAVAANMDFTVVTIGAIAVSLDVNAADRIILDGTALSDGDKATNRSTSGDTITCHYESASGFFCWSGSMHATEKHWSDGN